MPMPVCSGALALSIVVVAAFVAIRILPVILERSLNKVVVSRPHQIRLETRNRHDHLLVVDLHADPLLWNRNLLQRHTHGHVDVPRLIEGNVALQVFATVTKIPLGVGLRLERIAANSDIVTLLAVGQVWPHRTWGSLLRRALYQAEKLRRFCADSQGRLILVTSTRELNDLLAKRRTAPELVGALLALEGVHALEGDLANLDVLYDAGFRMIGLSHFFDNEVGGSATGVEQGGLTPFGHEVVQRIQEKNLLLDLAHSSSRLIDSGQSRSTRGR